MQNYMNPYAPMQGMSQPPYQNYNQPMSNPYMERMNQLQNYQQSLQMQPTQMSGASQAQGLVGKVVNDFAEITANDVPMNGISAVFPKTDMSEIQLRAWTPNGTIQTITYKPISPDLSQNQSDGTNIPQNDFTALNEDVKALREDIKDMRSMIEKSMGGKATASKVKKAEGENE